MAFSLVRRICCSESMFSIAQVRNAIVEKKMPALMLLGADTTTNPTSNVTSKPLVESIAIAISLAFSRFVKASLQYDIMEVCGISSLRSG